MQSVFQIKNPKNVVWNIFFPLLVAVDSIMFSIASNMGTNPANNKKVV
jgi:hypothetical protein